MMGAMLQDRLGRYHLEEEVGRGGMAVVYRATDPALDRPVALKVLHPHLADRADSRERFTREARAVARLAHPHIVEVYDYATPDSRQAYIVTEFIDGPTLRAFVEAHPIRHSEMAALLMVPVFESLEHAHKAGIVHRDVKPENIMLRSDGSPVLMDFGIAQMIDMETLTKTGMMLGSPAHMAPEVVEGEEIGILADIFSAGTVLYWLVCDALPFTGPNPAALFRRILECRFDPVLQRRPAAGRPMARLVERCLAKEPAERPQSAGEVANALRAILNDAGLGDVRQELSDYCRDPEVYQDALTARLIPRYVQAARKAIEAKATARALDFLDRVLRLDDEHDEAKALLARVERGQRKVYAAQAAAALVVLAGLGGWIYTAWESTPGAPGPDAAPIATAAVDAAPVASARAPDAARRPPDAHATRPRDAAIDAHSPDAGTIVVDERVARFRPRRRPRTPVRRAEPPRPADAGPPPKPTGTAKLFIKTGRFKGGQVSIDGGRPVSAVTRELAGWELDFGAHSVELLIPGCKPQKHSVRVDAAAVQRGQVARKLNFECAPLPATVRIASNQDALIRRQDGTRLGRTNQDIEVKLSGMAPQRVTLTVGDARDKLQTLVVTLAAGQKTVKRVDF